MNMTWQGVEKYEEYENGRKFLREINTYIERLDPYKHPRSTHTVTTSSPLLGDGWMNYVIQRSSDGNLATVEFAIFPVPFVNAGVAPEANGAGTPAHETSTAIPCVAGCGTRPFEASTLLSPTAALTAGRATVSNCVMLIRGQPGK